jgi:hypothetical protein
VLLVSDTPWDPIALIQLERICKRAGLDPELFAAHSIVSCKVTKLTNKDAAAITHCSSNLDATIKALKPRVIVPMGELALQQVAGVRGIMRYRGRVLEKEGRWIVPTLHPRELLPRRKGDEDEENALQNPPRFTGVAMWDLKKALALADTNVYGRLATTYLEDPTPERFALFALEYEAALKADPSEVLLSWDIETPYKLKKDDEGELAHDEMDSTIVRISFAFKPGYAVSVPWSGPYLPTIKRLLASPGRHVTWNGSRFDVPLVESVGLEVKGVIEDHMWGFHLWQSDLPKGLEWVSSFFTDLLPWKHLNNEKPAFYSCVDADAALRNAIGLQRVLTSANQWGLFQRHVVELDPILMEAGKRGNLIDLAKQKDLKERFTKERDALIAECQGMVDDGLKPRKRYKKLPKGFKLLADDLVEPGGHQVVYAPERREFAKVATLGKVKRCTVCGAEHVKKSDHFKGGKKNSCKVNGGTIEIIESKVIEWDEILPFNPNSGDQLKAYIKHHHHPLGTNRQTGNESSDSKHLAKLAKRYPSHPLYKQTIKIHKVSKALSTYVNGFTPDAKGMVYTVYDHSPSTWRLASKNCNFQNIPKRDGNPYAVASRDQLIARPGHVFVSADSSAIEAVMVGWYMGDDDYIKLARKGVHDFLTCYELGIPFTKEAIADYKEKDPKKYKATRDKCKVVVHGTSYGMTPALMIQLFPDIFPTKAEAKRMQEQLFAAIPALKQWQHDTRVRAHKEGSLATPFGYRHAYFDVFKRDQRTGEVVMGGDGNKAVAFLPQNSAAAFMKDNLLILGKTWLRPYMGPTLTVHDSYTVDVPEDRAEEAVELLVSVLTRPIPEMGGLQIGCEVEIGRDWGSGMKTIRKVEV